MSLRVPGYYFPTFFPAFLLSCFLTFPLLYFPPPQVQWRPMLSKKQQPSLFKRVGERPRVQTGGATAVMFLFVKAGFARTGRATRATPNGVRHLAVCLIM